MGPGEVSQDRRRVRGTSGDVVLGIVGVNDGEAVETTVDNIADPVLVHQTRRIHTDRDRFIVEPISIIIEELHEKFPKVMLGNHGATLDLG